MKHGKFSRISLLAIVAITMACAGNMRIQLVDDDKRPELKQPVGLQILDEEQELLFDGTTNQNGVYVFDKAEIVGDSFYVRIVDDLYFETMLAIHLKRNPRQATVPVSLRITTIRGVVYDFAAVVDGEMIGIDGCTVTILPNVLQRKILTDENGEFVIRSDQFTAGQQYSLLISKEDYREASANVMPNIDKINILTTPIYLKPVELPPVPPGGELEIKVDVSAPVEGG